MTKIITGNNFPKEVLKMLGLPSTTQEFSLHVAKNEVA